MSHLKEKRKEAGMSQAQLAEKSGVNIRMIQHYEQGFKDFDKASVETAVKLAKALKCTVEDLI